MLSPSSRWNHRAMAVRMSLAVLTSFSVFGMVTFFSTLSQKNHGDYEAMAQDIAEFKADFFNAGVVFMWIGSMNWANYLIMLGQVYKSGGSDLWMSSKAQLIAETLSTLILTTTIAVAKLKPETSFLTLNRLFFSSAASVWFLMLKNTFQKIKAEGFRKNNFIFLQTFLFSTFMTTATLFLCVEKGLGPSVFYNGYIGASASALLGFSNIPVLIRHLKLSFAKIAPYNAVLGMQSPVQIIATAEVFHTRAHHNLKQEKPIRSEASSQSFSNVVCV